jgi:hypothetical protein
MSDIVSVPVRPANSGNVFWKTILIVGTSATQTVAAAPNVNGGAGTVVVVVPGIVGPVVVVPGMVVVVVVDGEVVVVGPVVDVGGTVVVVGGSVVVVGGSVVVVVVDVVTAVVVVVGGQFGGKVTEAVAVSGPSE